MGFGEMNLSAQAYTESITHKYIGKHDRIGAKVLSLIHQATYTGR